MTQQNRTAIVLGGGGVTGIAWELGVLKGLADSDFDVRRDADVVIGTSAGAFAGFAAVSGRLERAFQEQLDGTVDEVPASMSPEVRDAYGRAVADNPGDPTAVAKAFGALALNAHTIPAHERAAVVRDRLQATEWPSEDFRVTAIDADTGELVLLDRSSGLTLEEAACATGAVPGVWPLVAAGGRRWIDGGMISTTNPQLAEDYARVVIVAPVPGSMLGASVADVARRMLDQGAAVEVIVPDVEARAAIGPNPFDPARRKPAALAGLRQGTLASQAVRRLAHARRDS